LVTPLCLGPPLYFRLSLQRRHLPKNLLFILQESASMVHSLPHTKPAPLATCPLDTLYPHTHYSSTIQCLPSPQNCHSVRTGAACFSSLCPSQHSICSATVPFSQQLSMLQSVSL
jgi:hypothetical protein